MQILFPSASSNSASRFNQPYLTQGQLNALMTIPVDRFEHQVQKSVSAIHFAQTGHPKASSRLFVNMVGYPQNTAWAEAMEDAISVAVMALNGQLTTDDKQRLIDIRHRMLVQL
jgi:hypothetical protein